MDLLLYNPLSKNSKSNIQTHKLVRYYKKNKIPFRLKSIVKIKDIEQYLKSKNSQDNIILLGGDGTINRFINDIYNLDISQNIYLKKNGSGNDFLRTLKLDDTKPQTIMNAKTDTGVNTKFMNGAGIGIDGYVGYLINKSEKKGKFSYFLNTLKALIQYIPEPLEVVLDDTKMRFEKAYLITMNNGKYFGGGMKISPKADLTDEYLDVVIVHTISKLLVLPIFFTIYVGKHTWFKRWVYNTKAKKVTATFTTPQISQADGENYYDITTMTVEKAGKKIHLKSYIK